MKIKSCISIILCLALLLCCFVSLPFSASATDYSGLSNLQVNFLRTIGGLARKDYYDTQILGSITVGQAIYEGGWAQYALPVGGYNLFGIKAFSTWTSEIFDQDEKILYQSYADFVLIKGAEYTSSTSAWRAYKSWDESVTGHSTLFHAEDKYSALIGETDYKKAAYILIDAGYTNGYSYSETLIKIIERYGLAQYDDITPDEDGVIGIVLDRSTLNLDKGQTHQFVASAYPAETTPSAIVWKSENEAVASVTEAGLVTAVSQGTALITATLENGREACCVLTVDCNAAVFNSDVYVRQKADVGSANNGKLPRGTRIRLLEDAVYTDSENNSFYKVSGVNSSGKMVTGYALADFIYPDIRDVKLIGTLKSSFALEKNTTYKIDSAVAPSDASDKTLTWQSSDESIASVKDGVITTYNKEGKVTVTITAKGGVYKQVTVSVGKSASYSGVTKARVHVRKSPDVTSDSLGILPLNAAVAVTGEPVGGWYKVKGTTANGKTVEGYTLASYVLIDGEEAGSTPTDTDYYSAVTTSRINVRKGPTTSDTVLGIYAKDAQITVIGKEEDGWYYTKGTSEEGETIDGYCSSAYIEIISQITPNGFTIIDKTLSADSVYLYGVPAGITSADLMGKISMARVFNSNGEELNVMDKVKTGCVIKAFVGNAVIQSLIVVVTGDVNGNGECDTEDYLMVKRAFIGTYTLSGANQKAALVSGTDKLTIVDYMMIKRVVLGTYSFNQER